MKSKFVRHLSVVHPSVGVEIISERNARISFKFWLLPPLGHMLTRFLNFLKTFFLRKYFFFFVNMGPHGSENFKTRPLLQIAAKRFQTFPEFFSQWSFQNHAGDF